MKNKHVLDQIKKDFAISNFNNLFKGETRGNEGHWYLIDTNKNRRRSDGISEGEWKYEITYTEKEVWIGKYNDILDEEGKLEVIKLMEELDSYNLDRAIEAREVEKNRFITETFGNII